MSEDSQEPDGSSAPSDTAASPGLPDGRETEETEETGDSGVGDDARETEEVGDDPNRLADRPPGFDDDDPYADGLEGYPAWWRENAEAFRSHGMRPYRPPKFADGTLVPELLERLESELGVELELRKHMTPDTETAWTLVVDGKVVETLERARNEEGRSVYACSSEAFEALVRDAGAE